MNPLDAIERVAKAKHSDLHLVFGDIHDFNRAVHQELINGDEYPALFVQKVIQPRLTLHPNRYTATTQLQLYFMLHPDILDKPVDEQREMVESMVKKATEFLYSFTHDAEVMKSTIKPATADISTIYYNQDFILYGCLLRFNLEYYPDYSIC